MFNDDEILPVIFFHRKFFLCLLDYVNMHLPVHLTKMDICLSILQIITNFSNMTVLTVICMKYIRNENLLIFFGQIKVPKNILSYQFHLSVLFILS